MDKFISTYFLENQIQLDYNKIPICFKPVELHLNEKCSVKKLQEVINHALITGEDAIFIVKKAEYFDEISSDIDVFNGIYSAVDCGIHFLLISGDVSSSVGKINNDISYICEVDAIYAFVITRVLFEPLMSISSDEISLEDLVNRAIIKKATLNSTLSMDWVLSNQEHKINIIIPFRNVELFIESCCESILNQHYNNYNVFLIDDCSSDNSLNKIPKNEKFIVISNKKRKYALENIIYVLNNYSFKSNEIILILDGDDSFSHEFVLPLINNIYYAKRCLLTYGSFKLMNSHKIFGSAYSRDEYRILRQATWKASHLKTFKFELFDKYRKIDSNFSHMKDKYQIFYLMTYDIALMFPLLELAGFNKIFFVKEPLYLYRLHDNNDSVVDGQLQYNIEIEIRAKKVVVDTENFLL
ncbi:glycosyltransferase family 2 protein [Sphingobacterium bovisgrunnientis]|uniref:glycosyltransferase family 2 protein n=1 Tax=Sphingobacterium bovisgrunnientis TaxID=1874697 RepID=UPI00135701DF|nr:glycosyltransferase family 2 protein [Sphingobacterium bovisgrunnientis]